MEQRPKVFPQQVLIRLVVAIQLCDLLLHPWIMVCAFQNRCSIPHCVARCTQRLNNKRHVRGGSSKWFLSTALKSSSDSTQSEDRPTVAIIGTGAVGGYYGARLWESGAYNVKFQLRGENYEVSKKEGFTVTSIDGDINIPPEELDAFIDSKEVGPVDWVIVALKSSSLEAIPALVYPLLEPKRTRILAIMNGMIEDDLIHLLREFAGDEEGTNEMSGQINCCAAVYAGMALICANRLGPGKVDHSFAGLLKGGLAASHPSFSSDEEMDKHQQAFYDLWAPSLVNVDWELSLLAGRWRKSLWNLPFNGISVAMGGITVDKIVNDQGLRKLAYAIMDETITLANTDLVQHGAKEEVLLTQDDKKLMMALSDNMGSYRTSTMLDFTEGRPMEVKYLFSTPVDRARKLGVLVPHLETIVFQIEALEKLRDQ